MTVPSAEALRDELPATVPTTAPDNSHEARERVHYDVMMRAQAEALNQITKQVIVAEPRPRDGLQSAVSRIEARLAVTEQSLASLDQRLSERMKGLDGDTTALGERLHGLRQRLEKFEEKQLTALAQLRLDVHNLRHSAISEPSEPSIQPQEPCEVLEAVLEEMPTPEPDMGEDRPSYLDTARKAAIEAAARATTLSVKPQRSWKKIWHKKRWLAIAVATVLVVWFDAYVFAHYQVAQGALAEQVPLVRPVTHPLTARAQFIRGLRYWKGTGVTADPLRAKLWVERAALRGDPLAENLMGVLAQNQPGTNMVVAIGWYETAARHGNVKALTNLGKLYAGGWKEGADFGKAATWFKQAAMAGDVDAAFNLAVLCERGLGRPRDIAEAYRWYAIAAGSGDKYAATRSTILAREIAPDKRDALDRAIVAFKPAPVDQAANELPQLKG